MNLLERLLQLGEVRSHRPSTPLHVEPLEPREMLSGMIGLREASPRFDAPVAHRDFSAGHPRAGDHVHMLGRNEVHPERPPAREIGRVTASQAYIPPINFAAPNVIPAAGNNRVIAAEVGNSFSIVQPPVVVIILSPPAAQATPRLTSNPTSLTSTVAAVSRSAPATNSTPTPSAAPQPVARNLGNSSVTSAILSVADEQDAGAPAAAEVDAANDASSIVDRRSPAARAGDGAAKSALESNWDEALRRIAAAEDVDLDLDELIELELQSPLRRKAKLRSAPSALPSLRLELRNETVTQPAINNDSRPQPSSRAATSAADSDEGAVWQPEDDGLIELLSADQTRFMPRGPAATVTFGVRNIGPAQPPAFEGRLGQYQAVESEASDPAAPDVGDVSAAPPAAE